MSVLLARYIWRQLPWSKKQDEERITGPQHTAVSAQERKKQILWLIRLTIALALPCILETLDYTGEPRISSPNIRNRSYDIWLQWWRRRSLKLPYVVSAVWVSHLSTHLSSVCIQSLGLAEVTSTHTPFYSGVTHVISTATSARFTCSPLLFFFRFSALLQTFMGATGQCRFQCCSSCLEALSRLERKICP